MGPDRADAPYPSTTTVAGVEWGERRRIEESHGDNWPMTWIEDDLQLLAWGDGTGFDGGERLSMGFAEVRGDPPENLDFEEFRSDADTPAGDGRAGRKASGLLQVEDMLYVFVRNARPGPDHRSARLAWSTDLGRTFSWADWHFSETFGAPAFVQFGPSYRDARDEYVYVVSQANDDAYRFSPDVVLARVPRNAVSDRDAYEFFAGTTGGDPADGRDDLIWSPDTDDCEAIFHDPNGTQRVSMTYNPGLDRYVLATSHEVAGQVDAHGPGFGVFLAPEPWGPWRTLYYDHDFVGGRGSGEGAYHYRFPARWLSTDGRTMWLVYSRLDPEHYHILYWKATLAVE